MRQKTDNRGKRPRLTRLPDRQLALGLHLSDRADGSETVHDSCRSERECQRKVLGYVEEDRGY